jgi:hypothetical protein
VQDQVEKMEKMEKMMKLPPPEDRKPSVMLAEMLEYCSAGEPATAIFAYLFLQQLCRETQVLLSKDNPADMRAIADKADHLITLHVPKGHDACTAGEDDQDLDLVAANLDARRKKVRITVPKQPQQYQQVSSGWHGDPH